MLHLSVEMNSRSEWRSNRAVTALVTDCGAENTTQCSREQHEALHEPAKLAQGGSGLSFGWLVRDRKVTAMTRNFYLAALVLVLLQMVSFVPGQPVAVAACAGVAGFCIGKLRATKPWIMK